MIPENKKLDSFLVCYDHNSPKDHPVLVVGRKNRHESVDVVKVFAGKEAEKLYNQLLGKDN